MSVLFQKTVANWCRTCFDEQVYNSQKERNYRFLEESLELVQSLSLTRDEAIQLVNYVYSRPTGIAEQEVGGVGVTLAALCKVNGIDMALEFETELNRIQIPEIIEKIRAKQRTKPDAVAHHPSVESSS